MAAGYRFTRTIDAPVEDVWSLLADHAGYRHWTPVPTSDLVRTGGEDTNGVGAVRRLGAGPIGSTEEVVAYEPPRHLAYTVVAGLPVRDYRADVHLHPDGERTQLTYEGRVEPLLPGTGWLMARATEVAVRGLVAALVRRLRR